MILYTATPISHFNKSNTSLLIVCRLIGCICKHLVIITEVNMRKPSQKLLTNLASNVKNIRINKGLSQEQLAEKCGLHRTYIGSIERSERNVTLSTLEVLSNTLEVSIAQLINN